LRYASPLTVIPAFKDEGGRRFFIGYKTAVAIGSLYLIARQEAREGEDPQKTRMNCRRTGTTPVPATFWFFFVAKKELAAETVDSQKYSIIF